MVSGTVVNNDKTLQLSRRRYLGASGLMLGSTAMTGLSTASQNEWNGQGNDDYGVSSTLFHLPLRGNLPAVLHEPVPQSGKARGINARSGIVMTHPTSPETGDQDTEVMASKGHRVVSFNTSTTVDGTYHLHTLLPEVAAAVEYLRDLSGIEMVTLVAHSGSGQLFSLYQNVAENGAEVCRDEDRLGPCPADLGDLPAADGLVILDAHMGYGVGGLLDIDPAVDPDEPNGERIQEVDLYDPANGFNPDGPSSYSDSFVEGFFEAQAERMSELVNHAQERVEAIDSGSGTYPDDEPMIVPGHGTAEISDVDPTFLSQTQEVWPVLMPDGSVEERVIQTDREADTDEGPPLHYDGGVLTTTVRKFLSTYSALASSGYQMTEDSIEGVDYSSTNAQVPGNLEGVTVPLTIVHSAVGSFVTHGEIFWNHAGSSNRSLVYVEGATHDFGPIAPEYGDPMDIAFDYVTEWISDNVL